MTWKHKLATVGAFCLVAATFGVCFQHGLIWVVERLLALSLGAFLLWGEMGESLRIGMVLLSGLRARDLLAASLVAAGWSSGATTCT